ncbi:uncharacterized protein LOC119005523 isoform X2 [Acanthopagrus latus]|nr:uncharacterized protein LOC119005523 isoform X2 [Acanthopagrus latus]XP_036929150.1 uncharacterized protein LOC119005523 isoform X2 [Acanthopagrus latus]
MGLSAAERQRQYRARRNADPERRAAYLQKHREKWHDDKKRGKVKNVKDLSEREKRKKQAYWRRAQRRSRERKKVTECLLTPPQSPEAHPQPRSSRQRIAAKKKVERESELYRELQTLKEKLKQQKRKTDKFRKKCERLQQDSESRRSKSRHLSRRIPVSTEVHKTLQLCKKCASTKHKHPRRVIAALVSGRILKKYKFKKRIQETLAISRKQQSHREISILSNKLKYRSLCFTLHNKVLSFLTRDENSCLAAGKSQTITRGKIKKQKRFLNDTMRNLHRRFLLESFDCKISYSLFCRMQPFWAVQPSIADRQTCLCKVHENLCFLVEKLHSLRLIRGTDLEKMAESICCDSNSKGCMYNECPDCKDRDFPVVSEGDLQAVVFFTQWTTETVLREKNKEAKKEKVSVKITAKKRTEATLQNLLELFQRQLTNFKRHLFNIQRQFTYYRELKRGMTDRECLIHVDFSENYTCKHSSKIQAEHVEPNQQQATLHAGVLHVGGVEEHVCFATISPSKEKGPAAIWSHLSPILDLVKTSCPNVTVVHFFSDGRCTQYSQKGNFYLFCTKLQQCGFQSGTWNFFEASHGKGAPDVVAGLLKRTADRIVSHGKDIRSAERFFNALVEAQTSVKLFYISENKINEATKSIPDRLPVVPSTMSIHQVVTVTSGQISYRDVSCLCSMRPTLQCQCYNSQNLHFQHSGSSAHTGGQQSESICNSLAKLSHRRPVVLSEI